MTGDAVYGRMRADQRETIFVSSYGLQRYIPAHHAVALLAIPAELASVDIGMAVRAARAHVAEYRFGMALDAIDLRVHAAQRIAGCVVVELRDRADRLPARLCVAILAGNCQRPVRTARLRVGRTTTLSESGSLNEHEQEQGSARQHDPLEHERPVLRT